MRVIKQKIDTIERVYATSFWGEPQPRKMLVASEGFGECKVISLPGFEKETVLNNPGGTTDLCPHPNDDSVFFAICGFIPVFKSEEAHFAYVKKNDGGEWEMKPIKKIPFLHRFDLVQRNQKLFFIGGILCGSKKNMDDWSDPGRVIVAEIDPATYELKNETVILEGLPRNHGFIRTSFKGVESCLISCDNGVWVIPFEESFPEKIKSWKLLDSPASDVAVFDIDGDGDDEIAMITPFHGNQFSIQKEVNGEYKSIYEREIEFGHVLWGGLVNGIPSFVLGYRKGNEQLLLLRNDGSGGFTETLIDDGAGPSQISGYQGVNCYHILSANRRTGNFVADVLLYTLFEESPQAESLHKLPVSGI